MKRWKLYNFIQSLAHEFERRLPLSQPAIQLSLESRNSKFMENNFPQT